MLTKLADDQGTWVWFQQQGVSSRKENGNYNVKSLARFRIPPEITQTNTFKKTWTGRAMSSFHPIFFQQGKKE